MNSHSYRSRIIGSHKNLLIYTGTCVEIYNLYNKALIYKTYKIIEINKYSISIVGNPLNLGIYKFYKILIILQSVYIVLKDINSKIFDFNDYIN